MKNKNLFQTFCFLTVTVSGLMFFSCKKNDPPKTTLTSKPHIVQCSLTTCDLLPCEIGMVDDSVIAYLNFNPKDIVNVIDVSMLNWEFPTNFKIIKGFTWLDSKFQPGFPGNHPLSKSIIQDANGNVSIRLKEKVNKYATKYSNVFKAKFTLCQYDDIINLTGQKILDTADVKILLPPIWRKH